MIFVKFVNQHSDMQVFLLPQTSLIAFFNITFTGNYEKLKNNMVASDRSSAFRATGRNETHAYLALEVE